jgi:hypothetical protein
MSNDRCPNCDRPKAVWNNHREACDCAYCVSVCWSRWGTTCPSVDWRARALRAEEALRAVEWVGRDSAKVRCPFCGRDKGEWSGHHAQNCVVGVALGEESPA